MLISRFFKSLLVISYIDNNKNLSKTVGTLKSVIAGFNCTIFYAFSFAPTPLSMPSCCIWCSMVNWQGIILRTLWPQKEASRPLPYKEAVTPESLRRFPFFHHTLLLWHGSLERSFLFRSMHFGFDPRQPSFCHDLFSLPRTLPWAEFGLWHYG